MNRFEYATPSSVQQAVGLLSATSGDSEILAGGTDLLGRMKDYVSAPKRIVNIKNLPGLHAISRENGGVRIGALVTGDGIAHVVVLERHFLRNPFQRDVRLHAAQFG